MPNLYSFHWDSRSGECLRHSLFELPCPKCLAEKDPNIKVVLTLRDREALAWNPNSQVSDLFSKEEKWLEKRIQ